MCPAPPKRDIKWLLPGGEKVYGRFQASADGKSRAQQTLKKSSLYTVLLSLMTRPPKEEGEAARNNVVMSAGKRIIAVPT